MASKKWTTLEAGWVFQSPPSEYGPAIRRHCIELTGDFISGQVLSWIVQWFLVKKDDTSKLKIKKKWPDGEWHKCLAKDDKQFHIELGTTPSQTKTAIKKLIELDLIQTGHWRFFGNRTRHILLNKEKFAQLYEDAKKSYKASVEEDKKRFKDAVEARKESRIKQIEKQLESEIRSAGLEMP